MTRFGSGPSATSISTCEMPTLTVTSETLNDHSPSSRLCASISCPASSSAASTALRASSGEISSFDRGGSAAVSSATAVAVPADDDDVADSTMAAGSESVKLGCASAFGPPLRLRSASNGDGLLNGDAAGERVVEDSASLDDRETTAGRDVAGATGRDEPEPERDVVPGALVFTASPLSNSSSGSRRCACTNFSRPSSRWKRCSCL